MIGKIVSDRGRPVRFVIVGGTTGAAQLILLSLLLTRLPALQANPIAFAVSAQLNFILGQTFTWHDRAKLPGFAAFGRRWLTFHACIATTAVLNMTVFFIVQAFLPPLSSAALGIAVAAAANFLLNDRLTFDLGADFGGAPHAVVNDGRTR